MTCTDIPQFDIIGMDIPPSDEFPNNNGAKWADVTQTNADDWPLAIQAQCPPPVESFVANIKEPYVRFELFSFFCLRSLKVHLDSHQTLRLTLSALVLLPWFSHKRSQQTHSGFGH